ncbi:MAG: cytochrome ubiquinol oxidase subunit I [Elusimicrobia bacterium]|nr:cytochrome ubiquinol oxidase subunit I [Elusimicrobiota bacterium]
MLDAAFLSRLQFAMTIMFHYLFPPLTIGLALLMVAMEWLHLRTGDKLYASMTRFWARIFAVNFAMGVATGITMEFQFGTNWAAYARFVGDVFGPALAAEGILAFFLESCFLGVLLFGWNRVPPRVHFLCTVMVALGSVISAFLITAANSWQQTPAGHVLVGTGPYMKAQMADFFAMVFSPSSLSRFAHVLMGCCVQGSFVVMGVCSYYLLRGRHVDFAKKCFPLALGLGLASTTAMLITGHRSAVVMAQYQPAKAAALEGLYESTDRAGLPLIGFPDSEARTLRYKIEIPGLLTWLIHGSKGGRVQGLNEFPREDWPPVFLAFQVYHAMLGLGTAFICWTLLNGLLLWRGTLFSSKLVLMGNLAAALGPYLANQFGWAAAELGRQPWTVYGVLRTQDSVSAVVPASHVLGSLLLFGLLYLALFCVWLFVMADKIEHGPEDAPPEPLAAPAGGA